MSQISSQDPNWVSIPIAKYSHNTSPYGTRHFVWNHVGVRNDLDFIVRDTRVIDENGNYANRIVMKITAGADVLESQDLGELVKVSREFDTASGVEFPIQFVTRSPFLALRYPKSINTVQRIQLKFHNDSDFTRATNALRELGLRVTASPSNPTSHPGPTASPSPSMLSSSSTATLTAPASSAPLSSSDPRLSRGLAIAASMSSSSPEFKVPSRPEVSSLNGHRPSSAHSYSTYKSSIPSDSLLSNQISFHNATQQFPSLYASQIERDAQSRRLSYPVSSVPTPLRANPSSNLSLYVSQMQTQNESSERDNSINRMLTTSPFFSAQSTAVSLASNLLELDLPSKKVESLDRERPASTPLEHDTRDLHIPPKRELPFPKRPDTSKASSSSNSEPPSLPKDTLILPQASPLATPCPPSKTTGLGTEKIPTPALKPATKRVAQRKAPATQSVDQEVPEDALPAKKMAGEILKTAGANVLIEEPSPLAAKSAAAARPASAGGLQSKATAAKKRAPPARPSSVNKRVKMVDQGTQTQTLSGRDHTAAMRSIPDTNAPDPIVVERPLVTPPESYLGMLDEFVTKHKSRPAPKELWEAPGYAEADEEQRHVIINDFICENLENKDFLLLCEDTEKAWRRIGLGM